MKTYSVGLLIILGVCGLGAACTAEDDDAAPQATGGSGAHQGAGSGNGGTDNGAGMGGGQGGTTGATEGGTAGGGEGGAPSEDAIRQARCEAVCSIVPTGDEPINGVPSTGEPCGHYDECVEALCATMNPQHESECLAAQHALYACLLEQDADKFYCQNGYLGIDYAGYYFCNDAFLTWGLYCHGA